MTICAMTATIMQALDTTIANVALPYMQGTLSASQDQINWVLTSYIVAAAIMTAPVGWIANRFGRKRIFIICSAGFTVASVLCGLAQDITQMVAVPPAAGRVRRGAGAAVAGGDARLLRAARARQGDVDLGHGRDDGPDHGPVAGRLADRDLFLALGVLRQFAVRHLHRARPHHLHGRDQEESRAALRLVRLHRAGDRHRLRCSWRSTAASSSAGWNPTRSSPSSSSPRIGFYYFLAHSLTTSTPFIQFALFKDKNFVGGCVFMAVMGLVLFSTMALSSPFLQNVIGYPIITAGLLLASRGFGTFVAMMLVGRMMRYIEARTLIISGLSADRGLAVLHDRAGPTRPA